MSNCIIYALRRWFRDGGFIVVRKSNYGWWPHMIWSADLHTYEEFAPHKHNHHLVLPPPIFKGVIKLSTAAEQAANLRKSQTVDESQPAVFAFSTTGLTE